MSHTPGPWRVGNGDVYAEGDESSDFDDKVICAIGKGGGFRSHEYAVIKPHKPEGRANASLIAAAPELLEALIKARNTLAGTGHPKIAESICDAAIAKARA